jgi:outer membrane receptor protein involved in Fe transport
VFNYQVSQRLHIDLNLYHLRIEESIDFLLEIDQATDQRSAQAQNFGKLKGNGIELELNYKISDSIGLLANYAYQKTKDEALNDSLGGAPSHQMYAQLSWIANESINVRSEIRYIGEQTRSSIKNSLPDPRSPTSSYTIFSFNLNYHDIFEGTDLQFKINNAFDKDIREPSLGSITTNSIINIPGDLPQSGRTIFLGLQTTF